LGGEEEFDTGEGEKKSNIIGPVAEVEAWRGEPGVSHGCQSSEISLKKGRARPNNLESINKLLENE